MFGKQEQAKLCIVPYDESVACIVRWYTGGNVEHCWRAGATQRSAYKATHAHLHDVLRTYTVKKSSRSDPTWDLPAMFRLHNAVSAQLSSKTDPPVAVTRVLYIGRTVSKVTLILQTSLSVLKSLTGTTFSFPLSSTTKGIFSGLIHECESTEPHICGFTACTTCTTL